MENIQKIPTIKILNKGETYAINRAVGQQNPNKQQQVKRTTERERQQWLQEIPTQNSFSSLTEEMDTHPTEKPRTHIPKPPPIYIDAKIIDPLIDLLNSTAGKENYTIKQLKLDQKLQSSNQRSTPQNKYKQNMRGIGQDRTPGKHLTVNCPHTGKINDVKCHNCSGNHSVSYKGCVVRRQVRNRTHNNFHTQQDNTESMSTPNTQHVMNNNHTNTNTVRNRSYAQVVNRSSPLDNQEQNNPSKDATEIKDQVSKEHIKAPTVTVQTNSNQLQLSAVHVPPRDKITTEMWEDYFRHLGDKYIAAGDYNSKHTLWGSRITTPRDLSKIPDLLDFAVAKGLNANKLNIAPSLELTSDHTPIIITYRNKPILYSSTEKLCNKTTKWHIFKYTIESKISCNNPLKTPAHIDQAVTTLTETMQEAARFFLKKVRNSMDKKEIEDLNEKVIRVLEWSKKVAEENQHLKQYLKITNRHRQKHL
ncbi:probable basic-leucine zipper transcription factor O [Bombus bifarius]|uniref:Probable basic-leucine zipper transcription factor O n=1 Tax=Bombus bifarius TaxID=103933 RepID=A0A6P8N1F0_9HYME|nr:probable basic-leucine zipper transcription factor O [Bombus bifarius]